MAFNFFDILTGIIKKEIIPTELICYPIVTSVTIFEVFSAFRIVDYYYQFIWPSILLIYTPFFIAALVCTYYFYRSFYMKLVAFFSVVILIGLKSMVERELNDFSSPPKIFFDNYFKVLLILSISWLLVAFINEYLKKKADEFKQKDATMKI